MPSPEEARRAHHETYIKSLAERLGLPMTPPYFKGVVQGHFVKVWLEHSGVEQSEVSLDIKFTDDNSHPKTEDALVDRLVQTLVGRPRFKPLSIRRKEKRLPRGFEEAVLWPFSDLESAIEPASWAFEGDPSDGLPSKKDTSGKSLVPTLATFATMSAAVRSAFAPILAPSALSNVRALRIGSGAVRFHLRLRLQMNRAVSELEKDVRRCITATAALMPAPASIEAGLLLNAESDPDPDVRALNRELLLFYYPKTPEARAAATSVLDGCDQPRHTLAAALILETPGPVVDAVRQMKASPVDAPLVADALALVFASSSSEISPSGENSDGPKQADALVANASDALVMATIRAVSDAQQPWAMEWIRGLFERHSRFVGEAFDHVIPLLDSPGAEAFLLDLIGPAGDSPLGGQLDEPQKITVIKRLGLIGTAQCVPILRTYCDELFDARGPKTAAKAAIADVQARIKGGEVGQLSVMADDTLRGGLSDTEE